MSKPLKNYGNKKVEHHVGCKALKNYKEGVARFSPASTNASQLYFFETLTFRALKVDASFSSQVRHQHRPVFSGA